MNNIEEEDIGKRYSEGNLKQLWLDCASIPVDDEDNIEVPFHLWEVGTSKFEIWHWFDERVPFGIRGLLGIHEDDDQFQEYNIYLDDNNLLNFFVDIPDSNGNYSLDGGLYENPWINVGQFSSRERAILFCQENFGSDEEGRICLISPA